jgi:hypothetical protein
MIFWKHSEGVFRTPWRVYWYLFVCYFLVVLLFVNIDAAYCCFFPSRAVYLYCDDRCRVPMISIWREVKSWSRFAWYSHAFVDRRTLIPRVFIRGDGNYSSITHNNSFPMFMPRYTLNSYTYIQETSQHNPTIFKFDTIHVSAVYRHPPALRSDFRIRSGYHESSAQ